jgi:alpha-L-fucosidase 2
MPQCDQPLGISEIPIINRRQFISNAGIAAIASRLLQSSRKAFAYKTFPATERERPALTLWYDKPAAHWNEAIPLGNGRIGAMVFGRVDSERIQFNEATLWTGKPHDYANPEARKNLDKMRDLIFHEDVEAAENIAGSLLGIPSQLQAYQPFCDLHIDFYTDPHTEQYRRSLDLRSGITSVTYLCGDVHFRREAFVSFPDQAFVLHLSADKPGQQSLKLSLATPHSKASVQASSRGELLFSGELTPHTPPPGSWIATWEGPGLKFAGNVRILHHGGNLTKVDEAVMIDGADEVTILVDLATSFVNYRDISGETSAPLLHRINSAASRSFDELKSRHTIDYAELFSRVDLQLGDSHFAALPTDREIANYAATPEPELMALYYQVGRYLLIAASRPGSQPANLQGIWNESLWPWWGGKWTANINLQMNYWPAETGGLAECVEPFYDLLADLRITGAEVARVHYGCKGFVFHHNADLWRAAAPVDGSWGLWPVGGAWLALQTWEHYAFSLDKEFLRTVAYPALKESVEFMLSFLVEIPPGRPFAGHLATNPTSSPENAFILPSGVKGRLTYATTMDIEIIGELFEKYVLSAQVLDIDPELVEAAEAARRRLPPLQVSRNGELQEWIGDYEKTEAEHRHLSHLYSLYPGDGITPQATPALAVAARKSLGLRGDGDGPGSCFKAWRSVLWARLGDGNRAHRILSKLISQSTSPDMLNDHYDQIDGHLGGPSAIAEMLIQSHSGEIVLLPALPDAWASGSVRGMRARGAASLDFSWKNGSLISATVHAKAAGTLKIRYGQIAAEIECKPGSTHVLNSTLQPQ